jgi:hypothetical protein
MEITELNLMKGSSTKHSDSSYNTSYLGVRDWEDGSLKSAWAKSLLDHNSTHGWAWKHVPVFTVMQGSTSRRITVYSRLGIK